MAFGGVILQNFRCLPRSSPLHLRRPGSEGLQRFTILLFIHSNDVSIVSYFRTSLIVSLLSSQCNFVYPCFSQSSHVCNIDKNPENPVNPSPQSFLSPQFIPEMIVSPIARRTSRQTSQSTTIPIHLSSGTHGDLRWRIMILPITSQLPIPQLYISVLAQPHPLTS